MIVCKNTEIFRPGKRVKSLVNRPPNIDVGTLGSIYNRWVGRLYAVKMPNGDLYRWLSSQDLFPVDSSQPTLRVGDLGKVQLSRQNRFYHPQLENGVIVKIVDTDYYEVFIDGEGNFGWFTGFELSTVF